MHQCVIEGTNLRMCLWTHDSTSKEQTAFDEARKLGMLLAEDHVHARGKPKLASKLDAYATACCTLGVQQYMPFAAVRHEQASDS